MQSAVRSKVLNNQAINNKSKYRLAYIILMIILKV